MRETMQLESGTVADLIVHPELGSTPVLTHTFYYGGEKQHITEIDYTEQDLIKLAEMIRKFVKKCNPDESVLAYGYEPLHVYKVIDETAGKEIFSTQEFHRLFGTGFVNSLRKDHTYSFLRAYKKGARPKLWLEFDPLTLAETMAPPPADDKFEKKMRIFTNGGKA